MESPTQYYSFVTNNKISVLADENKPKEASKIRQQNIMSIYEPFHELLVFIAYAQCHYLNMLAQLSSGIICIIFGLSFPLHPFFGYASSKFLDETAHLLLLDAIRIAISCGGSHKR